jgi:hypothetical protein
MFASGTSRTTNTYQINKRKTRIDNHPDDVVAGAQFFCAVAGGVNGVHDRHKWD